jgi:restriction endonuclease Mrr
MRDFAVTIPTYDRFIEPLLRYLAEQAQPVATRDVYAALADRVGLSDTDRQTLLPSQGQLVYKTASAGLTTDSSAPSYRVARDADCGNSLKKATAFTAKIRAG